MKHITKTDSGWVVDTNGQTMFVPEDHDNEQCREILELIAAGLVVSEPAPAIPAMTLSKIDFCRALYAAKILPADLVVDAALGKWPATFEGAIVSLPEAGRVDAKLTWAGATAVSRTAPLFLQLLAYFAGKQGLTAAQAEALGDQIFGINP